MPGHIDSIRAHFYCHPRFFSGEPLSLLGCAHMDELDCLIRRERIKLGDVVAMIFRLFAQCFYPCCDLARPVITKYPTAECLALVHLPESNLTGDLMGLRGFCTRFDHLKWLLGHPVGATRAE